MLLRLFHRNFLGTIFNKHAAFVLLFNGNSDPCLTLTDPLPSIAPARVLGVHPGRPDLGGGGGQGPRV